MRVMHLDTEPSWRGGQRQALLLGQELRRRGVEQVVLGPPGSPLLQACAAAALPTLPIRQRTEVDPLAALALRRAFERWRPDIVHTHAGHAHALAALALPRRWDRTWRLVVSRRVDNPPRRSLASRWKWIRADRILCVSKAIRDGMLELQGLDPARLGIVYSAAPRPAAPRRIQTWTPARPARLVTIGSLVAHKGHDVLLRALPLLRSGPVELCLFGEGPERPALERLVAEAGLQGRVCLAGFDAHATDGLAEHDLYLHPSRTEGLGSSILDAMLHGLPVVASDAGGIGELVQNGRTGRLVRPEAPAELARAIDEALTEIEESRRMAETARRLAEQSHSPEALATATLAQYHRALEETPAPSPTLPDYRMASGAAGVRLERREPTGSESDPTEAALECDQTPPRGRGLLSPARWHGVACWRKTHRRGGMLSGLRSGFLHPLRRIVRGLQAEQRARELGVAAPPTLLVELSRRGWGLWGIESLSQRLEGWRDLAELLRGAGPDPESLAEIGRVLRRLHDGGVDHGDLNVKNLMVGPDGGVAVLDFDPARGGRTLSLSLRRRRLRRLQRSMLKTTGRTEPWFSAILAGYGLPRLWGLRQEARSRLLHRMHALLWGRT
jgi:glycosyltransferase involved in cell wall biosynthesis/tRNA A-37 threonylcarbamoyl transferase component Bud32